MTTYNIGKTTIGAGTDGGNDGYGDFNQYTLSVTATIVSITIYVQTIGPVNLAIYDNSAAAAGVHPGPLPLNKIAETGVFTPGSTGWVTRNVLTPVSMSPQDFWIGFAQSDGTMEQRSDSGSEKIAFASASPAGTMPSTATIIGTGTGTWSMYATFDDAPGGTTSTFGETSSSGDVIDSGNTSAIASRFTNAATGNIVSLSMYITTVDGSFNLGVYSYDAGHGGSPYSKLGETGLFTPTVGWNTVTLATPIAVTPGDYWLAFSGDAGVEYPAFLSGGYVNTADAPGVLPTAWTSTGSGGAHWAIYATVSSGSGGGGGSPPTTPRRRGLLGVGI